MAGEFRSHWRCIRIPLPLKRRRRHLISGGGGAISSTGRKTVDGTVAVTGVEPATNCLLERPLTPDLDRRRPATLAAVGGGSATQFQNHHLYNK